MKEISNSDYAKVQRLLRDLQGYTGLSKLRQDEARRKARLLTQKFRRKDARDDLRI